MANGNSIKIRIDGDASDLEKKLKNVGNVTKAGLADVKAGIDMATVAVKKLADVASKGVNYNATIEQLKTSFEVMTGSAEKAADVVERLRTMGAETPFEFTDLASTTQLLMQYGFTADEAIDRMSMLGDIAQGNKEAMNSIALGYAQMSSAGKVNLQDIKQMINGGFNPLQEISERTGESMASLYDRISKGKMTVDEITQAMVHATSEGGKFYQSMEKQSQTLNGQLATLKDNADMLLGSLTEGVSEGLRDQILPFANNLVAELQAAFDTGGYQGLVDTATNMIPDLLGMMTGKLQDGISGLVRWLPQGAQKLMQALPSALRAGNAIVPQITQAMFEIAGSVVGDLVTMLPELAPLVGEGVLNLFKSVGLGAIDAINSITAGLGKALKNIGVIAPTAAEAFATLVEGVDQQTIDDLKKTVDVDITTDITVDDYQTKIDTAVDSIENALKNVPGLTEAEREIIKNAIIKGSGIDAVQLAFDAMGVDSTTATAAITTAQTNINTVVEGLGLSETAAAHIQSLIANNADAAEIQDALESFGIPADTASSAAASITTEMNTLNTTLSDLGVPADVIAGLRVGLLNDKQMIITSLKWLGITDADLKTILASYDTVAGSLTASIDGIYADIAATFTDGVPESDADVQAAKTAIEGVVTEAKTRLDKWRNDKIAALYASGLTGDTLTTELANIESAYNGANDTLTGLYNTAITQTESMVGQSTEFCEAQLATMRETFDLLKNVTAEIDLLTSENISAAETSRKLTVQGVTTDSTTQLEAIMLTYKEYTDKVRKAEEDYLAAIDEAQKAYDNNEISGEEYQSAEATAKEELAKAKQQAANYYQEYIDNILNGIMMADPQMGNILKQAVSGTAIGKLATNLNSAIIDAFNSNTNGETTITLEDILGQFKLDETDIANLAESLGLSPEDLMYQLNNALKTGDTTFGATTSEFNTTMNETIASMLSGEDIDLSGVTGTLATAIETGYLIPGINGIDYSDAATIFNRTLSTALNVTDEVLSEAQGAGEEVVKSAETGSSGSGAAGEKKGSDYGSGYVAGVRSWARAAYSAGYALGKETEKGTAAGQESHSPSKVAKRLGGYFGQGYTIGLEESMRQAVAVAKRMTGQISTAADISSITRIANMPNIQQEIMVANDQNKTPVILNGVKIAEIQGYNNSTQIAWQNTRAAKGVGSR